jgi:hypothetical protein
MKLTRNSVDLTRLGACFLHTMCVEFSRMLGVCVEKRPEYAQKGEFLTGFGWWHCPCLISSESSFHWRELKRSGALFWLNQ